MGLVIALPVARPVRRTTRPHRCLDQLRLTTSLPHRIGAVRLAHVVHPRRRRSRDWAVPLSQHRLHADREKDLCNSRQPADDVANYLQPWSHSCKTRAATRPRGQGGRHDRSARHFSATTAASRPTTPAAASLPTTCKAFGAGWTAWADSPRPQPGSRSLIARQTGSMPRWRDGGRHVGRHAVISRPVRYMTRTPAVIPPMVAGPSFCPEGARRAGAI